MKKHKYFNITLKLRFALDKAHIKILDKYESNRVWTTLPERVSVKTIKLVVTTKKVLEDQVAWLEWKKNTK